MGVSAEKYQQSLDYLFGRLNYERMGSNKYSTKDFQLGRMQGLLDVLGSPQSRVPTIHIAGTKGKGSTSVMIAEMLTATGFRTGLFTSPHITRYEERILIDGRQIEPETLITHVATLERAVDQLERQYPDGSMSPTFFELTTALAWLQFERQQVDYAVMEVGLGGRLDSTNVCEPLATLVTNISYDHTTLLGNTIEQITREKAGIIKPGIPVLSGVTQPEAIAVLEEVCRDKQAPLYLLNRDYFYDVLEAGGPSDSTAGVTNTDGLLLLQRIQVRTPWSEIEEMPVSLLGAHQTRNAALAVTLLDLIRQDESTIEIKQMQHGMATLKWPARIEVVQKEPTVVIDTAHNDASINALIQTLGESFNQSHRVLIFAATRDKDVKEMLQALLPQFETVILTQYLTNPRRIPVSELTEIANTIQQETGNTSELISVASPADAWLRAQESTGAESLICVTGSFFIAAEMRELLLASNDQPLVTEVC